MGGGGGKALLRLEGVVQPLQHPVERLAEGLQLPGAEPAGVQPGVEVVGIDGAGRFPQLPQRPQGPPDGQVDQPAAQQGGGKHRRPDPQVKLPLHIGQGFGRYGIGDPARFPTRICCRRYGGDDGLVSLEGRSDRQDQRAEQQDATGDAGNLRR